MDFLLNRQDIDHSKIVIYGRSLGGAVAIGIAANPDYMDNILAVIVENTFTSIPAIARHMFSWINKLPLVCYRNRVSFLPYLFNAITVLVLNYINRPCFIRTSLVGSLPREFVSAFLYPVLCIFSKDSE